MLVISIEDVRYKSVPVWQLGAMLLAFGMYMWIFRDANIENMIAGIMIGLFLIFISRATGWIGVGDGIVIGIVCALMGWLFVTQMFIIAVTLMSLTSMLLLMFKVVKMKYEIPFVPYMFLSAMGVLACG
jgi:Flp pilus assembly protein protease CpaA